jgi:hypothetical protein
MRKISELQLGYMSQVESKDSYGTKVKEFRTGEGSGYCNVEVCATLSSTLRESHH